MSVTHLVQILDEETRANTEQTHGPTPPRSVSKAVIITPQCLQSMADMGVLVLLVRRLLTPP